MKSHLVCWLVAETGTSFFPWYLSFSSQLRADIVGKPHETCFGFFGGTLSEFYGLGIFGGLSAGLMFCCLFRV